MRRILILLLLVAMASAGCGSTPRAASPTTAGGRATAQPTVASTLETPAPAAVEPTTEPVAELPPATVPASTPDAASTEPPVSGPEPTAVEATPPPEPTDPTAQPTERAVPTIAPTTEVDPTVAPAPTAALEPTSEPLPTESPQPTAQPEPTTAPTTSPGRPVARWSASPSGGNVNLRAAAGTDSAIVAVIPYGTQVRAERATVEGSDGAAWRSVMYDGANGFVLDSLLSATDPADGPTAGTLPPPSGNGPEWTLTAVGDIMLSRTVLRRIMFYDDYRHPYRATADRLRAADLTVANLELPLSDNQQPSSDPHTFTFVAPTAAADGLRWAGIDAVSLANNHTTNFGTGPLMDTIRALDEYGIESFGAGANREAAYSAEIIEVNGLKVALLGYDAVIFWRWSNPDAPGIATAVEDAVRESVQAASAEADVVIPFFHWGVEYTSIPNSFQRAMARTAINAGADLVLGAHPHWVQQVERYNGRLIVYSMGNFVFDQMWSRETRQGVIANFTFRGDTVVGTRWTPVLIFDFNQPAVATGADYYAVLNRMGVENGP